MEHIASLLPRVLRKRGLKDEAEASLVIHVARQWLREHSNVAPAVKKFERGILSIEARSSVETQECHAASEQLLTFLRERFPDIRLERVRIMRGASGDLFPS